MDQLTKMRRAFERNARALVLRPSIGRGTAVTRARLLHGLTCEVEEGPWKLTVDMSEKNGGNDAGPNPGVLGRGALASCLAMSYATRAALRGVSLDGVEVEVQAEYDARGHYGVADIAPGYERIRYIVTLESDAPQADLLALLDEADAQNPYRDVFRRPQDLRREVRIVAPRSR